MDILIITETNWIELLHRMEMNPDNQLNRINSIKMS